MRSGFLFWTLVVVVLGGFSSVGFLFAKSDVKIFLFIEVISVLAIALFVVLYHRLMKPYKVIASGVDLLSGRDFATRLRLTSNKEANRLIEIFNRMMDQLKSERLMVREKNHFLDLLIEASPQGVIILDFDEYITNVNPAGVRLLGIGDAGQVCGQKLSQLSQRDSVLGSELNRLEYEREVVVRGVGVAMYRCIRSSFVDMGFAHPFILIEEMTHELLRVEKESYEGVIRMMAHEVNNSIGAIGSTLGVVSEIIDQQGSAELDDALPAISSSLERCRHLGNFISNFADVVKIPRPICSDIHLNDLVRSVAALTEVECNRRDISISMELTSGSDIVLADGIQIEQVLINIVKNGYEAIGHGGTIRIVTKSSPCSIIIENDGEPITEEAKQRLFTPFFSTKTTGQGIGLMFVREVLVNHECDFGLDTVDGVTRFEIKFR